MLITKSNLFLNELCCFSRSDINTVYNKMHFTVNNNWRLSYHGDILSLLNKYIITEKHTLGDFKRSWSHRHKRSKLEKQNYFRFPVRQQRLLSTHRKGARPFPVQPRYCPINFLFLLGGVVETDILIKITTRVGTLKFIGQLVLM